MNPRILRKRIFFSIGLLLALFCVYLLYLFLEFKRSKVKEDRSKIYSKQLEDLFEILQKGKEIYLPFSLQKEGKKGFPSPWLKLVQTLKNSLQKLNTAYFTFLEKEAYEKSLNQILELERMVKASHQKPDFSRMAKMGKKVEKNLLYLYYSLQSKSLKNISPFMTPEKPYIWFLAILIFLALLWQFWQIPYLVQYQGKELAKYLKKMKEGKSYNRPPILEELGPFSMELTETGQELLVLKKMHKKNQEVLKKEIEEKNRCKEDLARLEETLQEKEEQIYLAHQDLQLLKRELKDQKVWANRLEEMISHSPAIHFALDEQSKILFWMGLEGNPDFPSKPLHQEWYNLFQNQDEVKKEFIDFLQSRQESAIIKGFFQEKSYTVVLSKSKGKFPVLGVIIETTEFEEWASKGVLLDQILKQMEIGICIERLDQNILYINPFFQERLDPLPQQNSISLSKMAVEKTWLPQNWEEQWKKKGLFHHSFELEGKLYTLSLFSFEGAQELMARVWVLIPLSHWEKKWQNIQKEEEKWRYLYENLPAPMVILKDHLVQDLNSNFCKASLWKKEEVLQKDFVTTFFAEEDRNKVIHLLEGKRKPSARSLYKLQKKDGGTLKVEIHLIPLDPHRKKVALYILDTSDYENLYESYEEVLAKIGKYQRLENQWQAKEERLKNEMAVLKEEKEFLTKKIEILSESYEKESSQSDRLRSQMEAAISSTYSKEEQEKIKGLLQKMSQELQGNLKKELQEIQKILNLDEAKTAENEKESRLEAKSSQSKVEKRQEKNLC